MTGPRFILRPRARLEAAAGDAGEGVLVDTHSATICACNESAWFLLEALAAGASREALVAGLMRRYEVDEEAARRDVDGLVARLDKMSLVDTA